MSRPSLLNSRTDLAGAAPDGASYDPRPVPFEPEDLPEYLSDELLSLGGLLNNVLQGGAFPPQTELPQRWREPMMIYFLVPPEDAYPASHPDAGQRIITSAGVWLYRSGKWWKIIDDPSEIIGGLTYYNLQPFTHTAPPRPDTGPTLPPQSPGFTWEEVPPQKPDDSPDVPQKSWFIYSTTLVQFDEDNGYEWSIPTIWSPGVEDGFPGPPGDAGPPGIDGRLFENWYLESSSTPQPPANNYPPLGGWTSTPPANPTLSVWQTTILVDEEGQNPRYPYTFPVKISGEDGEDGPVGPGGPPGTDGKRGTLSVSQNTTATAWDNNIAYNAILNASGSEGVVWAWDTVTLVNEAAEYAETRYYVSGVGASSVWQPLEVFIDGDAIVNGTLGANKIVANSITAAQISAGAITGNEINASTRITIGAANEVVILDANDASSRLWVGNTASANAAFRVAPNGDLFANSGFFGGEIYADNITGNLSSAISQSYSLITQDITNPTPNTEVEVARFRVEPSARGFDRTLVVNPVRVSVQSPLGGNWPVSVSTTLQYRRDATSPWIQSNVYTTEELTAANQTIGVDSKTAGFDIGPGIGEVRVIVNAARATAQNPVRVITQAQTVSAHAIIDGGDFTQQPQPSAGEVEGEPTVDIDGNPIE